MKPILLTFLLSTAALAAPQTYVLQPQANGDPGIRFEVPYTAGVHQGIVHQATANVVYDQALGTVQGHFSIPIVQMTTGDVKRDCHLRESLGLDYTRSKFPKDHVCDSSNQLPASGVDSIAFPTIEFEIVEVHGEGGAAIPALVLGQAVKILVQPKWTLHGVSPASAPIELEAAMKDSGNISLKGNFVLKLSDFGVVVKPFLFINVKGTVKVDLDLDLVKQ
jgi:polyisoprenoid-binding protein YceI